MSGLSVTVEKSPNPLSLRFAVTGASLLGMAGTLELHDAQDAGIMSPLGAELFKLAGVNVTRVFLGDDFLSINVADQSELAAMQGQAVSVIEDHLQSNKSAINDYGRQKAKLDANETLEDHPLLQRVREVIEKLIAPGIREDGGDIHPRGIDKNNIVLLKLKGSCSGCSSAQITLRGKIGEILKLQIPEIMGLRDVDAPVSEIYIIPQFDGLPRASSGSPPPGKPVTTQESLDLKLAHWRQKFGNPSPLTSLTPPAHKPGLGSK